MKNIFTFVIIFFLAVNAFAQKITYRVVVKFGSMCCGVPSNKPLLDYIAVFKKKNKIKKITYDSIGPMGKEGEYDMAFLLKEMKKKQVDIFVKEVTTLATTMKEQGYTNIEENIEIDKALLGRASIQKKNL
jgi:hypothetical protein